MRSALTDEVAREQTAGYLTPIRRHNTVVTLTFFWGLDGLCFAVAVGSVRVFSTSWSCRSDASGERWCSPLLRRAP